MYVPFDELPPHARVWVYQANRALTDIEEKQVLQAGQQFARQWAAHGQDLAASVAVFYQQFLVVAVDEWVAQASGCSIDSSVAYVKWLEETFGQSQPISFFDRTQIAFLRDDQLWLVPMKELKQKVADGDILPEFLTFNNTVATKQDLQERWLVPAQSSWLARYFSSVSA